MTLRKTIVFSLMLHSALFFGVLPSARNMPLRDRVFHVELRDGAETVGALKQKLSQGAGVDEKSSVLPKKALEKALEETGVGHGGEALEVKSAPAESEKPAFIKEAARNYLQGNMIPEGIIGQIRAKIEALLNYPLSARKRNLEGTVLLRFRINEEGLPLDAKVVKSSGHKVLDDEALRTINRAGGLPSFKGAVEVPITFRLLPL